MWGLEFWYVGTRGAGKSGKRRDSRVPRPRSVARCASLLRRDALYSDYLMFIS